MISVTTLALFALTMATVMVTPGPTMLLALANGATKGARVAGFGMIGAALSDLLLIGAVGVGFGALLRTSPVVFEALKLIGAAYLLFCAYRLWMSGAALHGLRQEEASTTARAAFARSLLTALSNPKGLLFFAAAVPPFVQPGLSEAVQYTVLAVVAAVTDVSIMIAYAASGHRIARILTPGGMRWLNRSCALMLVVLAALLALYNGDPNG